MPNLQIPELPAQVAAGPPELTQVAVTRWTARLVDPKCERQYLAERFPADRRRVLLLTGLAVLAGTLNLLLELSNFSRGDTSAEAVGVAVASILLPLLGLGVTLRLRSPSVLETMVVIGATLGVTVRLSLLSLHPDFGELWTTMIVGILLVIYLYLPIRLVSAVVLAVAFSLVSPFWWAQALPEILHEDLFYRGLICILVANGLGFAAANSLHRSQRMQFAQGLVLRQLLSTDAMTGIANRRRFDAALVREWRRCRRTGAPLSLLMIDVDHFKAYNDHCGHPQGDACLRQVAQLLVEVVGRPGDLAARYGGEEFVCLLPDVGSAGALAIANKLMTALHHADIQHPRSPGGPRLTVSIGVATAKDLTGEPDALVEFADIMLYAAKAAGRDQVIVGQLPANQVRRAA